MPKFPSQSKFWGNRSLFITLSFSIGTGRVLWKNYWSICVLKHCSLSVYSCSWPVSTVSLVLNRRQSLFSSAFLVFFATGSHLTFLVMEEQGTSLLFGSTLLLPCSKQSRDLSAVMDIHVILVWWDLLFFFACLKISLSFLSPSFSPVETQSWLSLLSCHFVFGG